MRNSSGAQVRRGFDFSNPAENSDSLGVRAASRPPRRNTARRILIRTRRMAGNARLFHGKVKAGLITPSTRVVSSPRCAVRGKSDRFDFHCLGEHTHVCVCVCVCLTRLFHDDFAFLEHVRDRWRWRLSLLIEHLRSVVNNRRFNAVGWFLIEKVVLLAMLITD